MSFPTNPLEQNDTRLKFALLLRDRLNFSTQLLGDVTVAAGPRAGWRKDTSGTFLFFDLPAGSVDFAVRSAADTPFYLPTDVTVMLPPASLTWPAFPDIALADPSLMLWDPAQPPAYRTQFLQACLTPAVAYPFDPTATLLRGMVLHAGAPLAGVTMSDVAGNAPSSFTGADGQFVLAFQSPPTSPVNVTVRAHRAGSPDVDTSVMIRRGTTTAVQINV
jgi:hypothetical protein